MRKMICQKVFIPDVIKIHLKCNKFLHSPIYQQIVYVGKCHKINGWNCAQVNEID